MEALKYGSNMSSCTHTHTHMYVHSFLVLISKRQGYSHTVAFCYLSGSLTSRVVLSESGSDKACFAALELSRPRADGTLLKRESDT